MFQRSSAAPSANTDLTYEGGNFEGAAMGRRFPRLKTDTITVLLDGLEYGLADISVCGFLTKTAPDWVVPGQGVAFRFVVSLNGEKTFVQAAGRVIRVGEKDMAVDYEAPHPNWRKILPAHIRKHG
ncbi:MAG: PilZ domain-containing protein [Alphaproteobacteria bacterium]|nr:PilZ domain-containing protein [Alphaproteobacteria bacterium]